MPRAKLPKLKIGAKKSLTKSKSSSDTGSSSKKSWWIAAAVLLALGVVGLVAFLLWTAFRNKDDKGSSKRRRLAKKAQRTPAIAKIDREKDREEPKALPAKVQTEEEVASSPAEGASPDKLVKPVADDAGLRFHVDKQSDMTRQFEASGVNSSQKKKILASQLGRESVLPSFSVERQPSRQIGMSYDMVYQALRGDDKVTRSFGEQVPFGGSEFQEMQRQMRA